MIRVDDTAYISALPVEDKYLRDAGHLRFFVAVREKENAPPATASAGEVVYKLCAADQVRAGDPAVAYRQHGIALVAQPAAP